MNERTLRLARYAGAAFLTALAACAGRYDVGDSKALEGSAGLEDTGGTSNDGGTAGTGGRGGSVGGSTGGNVDASGGTSAGTSGAGGSVGDVGGATGSPGGRGNGVGGASSPGGSGGLPSVQPGPIGCGENSLPPTYEAPFADPMTVWMRVEQAVRNSIPEAAVELPDEVTPAWAADLVSRELAETRASGVPTAGGFRRFMYVWLQTGDDGDAQATAELASTAMTSEGATFADLITPAGAPTLFEDPALNRLRPGISARGTWIQRSVQCADPGPPPPGTDDPLVVPDGMTRREALEQATSGAACKGCHAFVDPPGFALEGIDPITGEPRATDNGFPIDTSGTLMSVWEPAYSFASIRDLAPVLVESCEVTECFARQFAYDIMDAVHLPSLTDQELAYVVHQYVTSDRQLEVLLRAIVQSPTFLQ